MVSRPRLAMCPGERPGHGR